MEAKDFDKTLDLTKIKPYGDTMNDGKVQMSFTLPVPCGAEAVEAAKLMMKKMGLENPSVVYYKELTPGFTFFNCYGSCQHTVDYTNIYVPKVESNVMDMYETDEFIKTDFGLFAEHLLCKHKESALKVAHCDALVYNKTFYLVEHGGMCAVNCV